MVQGSVKEPSERVSSFEEAKTRAQSQRKGRTRVRSTMSKACFSDLFEMGERLGGGAYASVYSCWRRHPLSELEKKQEFAVKVIEKIPTHSRQRCLNEVELFFKCRSNNHIIKVEETFDEDHAFYIIFEKVHGGPLMNAISRCKTLSEAEVVNVVKELADAISFLHSINIAHRDLKPDNILCVSRNSISPVKLCDLDLGSKIEINHSRCGMTPQLLTPVGSAEYMAPEIVEGFVSDDASPYDKRCDLWSLGVVIYIMLCGYPPFCGDCGEDCGWAQGGSCVECQNNLFSNIQEGNFHFPDTDWAKVDTEAKDLVTKLLVKDPKQRLSAQMILEHPWIKSGGSGTLLNTPRNISKINFGSTKVSNFASSAMEMNSVLMQHMDIHYDSASSSDSDDTVYGTTPPREFGAPTIGDRFNNDPDDIPMGLSPPTASRLLQRRSQERRQEQEKRGLVNIFVPQLAH
uniref:MAP kinase-interacting serine/threonine-protein kinase 1-like n=1 Tax=Hirondellea gigas TaxID=1518452 RepID=A0A2P2HVK6_9CRUS